MWSEEELRDIEPEAPAKRPRSLAGGIWQGIAARNLSRAIGRPHEVTRGASVIYAPEATGHGNFLAASYRRILANPAWAKRLEKAHTAKRQARITGPDEEIRPWRELDAANSSDALLMNIFCYPRVLAGKRMQALLGIEPGLQPVFGYRSSAPRYGDLQDRTEIDMKLGSLLIEAKLTETDFQTAPLRLIERYTSFDQVFDRGELEITRAGVRSYQLLRGILAAEHEQAIFAVLLDARRTDLVEEWYRVLRSVRSFTLQSRLRVLTWQEIAAAAPASLQTFLADKYGIVSDPLAPR